MNDSTPETGVRPRVSRRAFLGTMTRASALLATTAVPLSAAPRRSGEIDASHAAAARRTTIRTIAANPARRAGCIRTRIGAAEHAQKLGFPDHAANGDATAHDPRWACYSKGLPHDAAGEADAAAMRTLAHATASGDPRAFEDVPLAGYVKLANPQAAFAYDLLGPDSHQVTIAPPPAFSSATQAAEMVEMYWHALARDVAFADWGASPIIAEACRELGGLAGYTGPRNAGAVTPETVFRGCARGARIGPYVSQFLWRDMPWTPIRVPQLIRIAAPHRDYMTTADEWLAMQNGAVFPVNDYEAQPRYIRAPRDLCEYVHRDFTYQAFLGACLMLFRMSAPVDGGLPYQYSISQSGFVTFGPSDITHCVAIVANIALKAAWYQKWVVHNRLRPEEYGARVHFHRTGVRRYPLHLDLLNSAALDRVASLLGTGFLPQSFPEGAPLHPSYPAGHAVVAGACATVLKAFFAESFVIPDPSVPMSDGLHLQPYQGPALTVGNELDKLAENVAFARNFSGLHWRSDAIEGLKFGESVAIEVLREMKMTANEMIAGFDITNFSGERVRV